LKKVRY